MNDAGEGRLTLACFPYAGADGSLFASWRSLGDEIEVLPLGATHAAAGEETLLDRAESLLAELRARCRTTRFAFFGHSLGALTAFEATRSLVRRGETLPEKLILSAHPPPGPGPDGSPPNLATGQSLTELVAQAEALPAEVLADEELLAEIVSEARRDLELLATYRYLDEPPLPLPLVVIGGRDDRLVDPATLPGWRRHCDGSFSLRLFSGGHMFIDGAGAEVQRFIGDQLRREAVDV